MTCLSRRVGNNVVAYVHNATTFKRSRNRNPNMIKIDGKEFPVQWANVDTNKLMHSLEAIAMALYFHERNKNFKGDCKIISEIFNHTDYKRWSDFHVRAAKII